MSDVFLGQSPFPGSPAVESRSSRRAADRRLERRRRRKRGRLTLLLAVLLVAGAGYVVWNVVVPMFSSSRGEAADFPGPGHGEVQVVVKPGDSGTAIGSTLASKGVVQTTKAFVAALTARPDLDAIQPGTYKLQLGMPAADAIAALLDPERRVELKVTIPEGLRTTQVLEKIAGSTGIPLNKLQKAAADPKALGVPSVAGGNLEGWLFPATYTYEPGTDAVDILASMVTKTVSVLTERKIAQASWETVLIKASIVEKEGKLKADLGKVARVIENRLSHGQPLGMDSTLAYGLDKSGLDLTTADIEGNNPYNTRHTLGLPPGPIGAVGVAAIDAVLNPTPGPWLFFVTVNLDTGETLFTDSYAQHLKNKALYQQWLAAQK